MSNKDFAMLSDEELCKQIAQYEKRERNLKCYGVYGAVIGVIGAFISMVLENGLLGLIFTAVVIAAVITYYLGIRMRKKAEALVNAQLNEFYETELERIFGSRMDTSEMCINEPFLKEIRPVDSHWDRCQVWSCYEGCYHGTHFSAANVELFYLVPEEYANQNTRQTVFKGLVLRCKDVCDPDLNIVLHGHGEDHRRSDLTDPAVFRQHFTAYTLDNQPADDLVTPQLRELIRKLEAIDNRELVDLEVRQLQMRLRGAEILESKHRKLASGLADDVQEEIRKMEACANHLPVTALILRNGEATLAINGYIYANGMKDSLQNLDLIRSRFTASLTPVGNLIDILRGDALFPGQD
ncbi:MAG: hypothetical protein ACI3XR_00955 [Eubacteriales bacterium]